MIPRYARPEMSAIWTPESKYGIWLEIETLAAEAMAEYGIIPADAAEAIRERGNFDVDRIDEIHRWNEEIYTTGAVGARAWVATVRAGSGRPKSPRFARADPVVSVYSRTAELSRWD